MFWSLAAHFCHLTNHPSGDVSDGDSPPASNNPTNEIRMKNASHPKPQQSDHRLLTFAGRAIACLTSALLVLLASCSMVQPTGTTKAKPKPAAKQTATGGAIRVGMSKSQVIQAWGEPSGRDISGRGEVWVWGNQNMLRLIPYAGPFLNVNTGKVLFRTGRDVDFRNTNSGSVWSQMEGMGGSRFSTW